MYTYMYIFTCICMYTYTDIKIYMSTYTYILKCMECIQTGSNIFLFLDFKK